MKKYSSALLSLTITLLCASCSSSSPESSAPEMPALSATSTSATQTTADITASQALTTSQTVRTTTATTTTAETTTATSTTTTTTVAVTTDNDPVPIKESYSGIDVSRWQGSTVDFEAVRNSGVEMVYIKAGDNYNEDMYFRQNAENAESAGLLTGFYFYVTAGNAEQARSQAVYFAGLLDSVDFQCRPAVDFEAFGSLSAESINEIALSFAQTVEDETGITPIFYTDADNADIWCEELTKYPLWIADYDANPPASIGKWSEYAGFQYSCTGVVDGITENVVDLDIYTKSVLF
ncbi:MAG: hypothetical protein IJO29_02000 [Oscillospiraceae bacterium]|nr:hypothetical protein [Oscillospiraceae bacterium]